MAQIALHLPKSARLSPLLSHHLSFWRPGTWRFSCSLARCCVLNRRPTVVKGDTSRRRKDALAKCEETVEHLKQENAELRKAALTFGELAERLNKNRRGDAQGLEPPSR